MNKTILASAVVLAMGSAAAQAAPEYNYAGTMTFYDAGGVVVTVDTNVTGSFDLGGTTNLGSFTTTQPFFSFLWNADVEQFFFYDTNVGGTQNFTYETLSHKYFYTDASIGDCHYVLAGVHNTCAPDPLKTVAADLGTTVYATYNFSLTNQGQFGAGVFFDWSTNLDIPVLAVMQVVNDPMVDGFMQVVSVDTDGDGVPGTAMLTAPFPGQQPSFSGVMTPVPVPAAVWLLGSGLLGLVGVARRKKA